MLRPSVLRSAGATTATTRGTATSAWAMGISSPVARRSSGGRPKASSVPSPSVAAETAQGDHGQQRHDPCAPGCQHGEGGEPADECGDDGRDEGEAERDGERRRRRADPGRARVDRAERLPPGQAPGAVRAKGRGDQGADGCEHDHVGRDHGPDHGACEQAAAVGGRAAPRDACASRGSVGRSPHPTAGRPRPARAGRPRSLRRRGSPGAPTSAAGSATRACACSRRRAAARCRAT